MYNLTLGRHLDEAGYPRTSRRFQCPTMGGVFTFFCRCFSFCNLGMTLCMICVSNVEVYDELALERGMAY